MKKKSVSTRRKVELYSILALILALFVFATSSAIYYRYNAAKLRASQNYPLQKWRIGEIVTDSRFAFSFNSVRTDTTSIPGFWELNPNYHFVLVQMSYKNTSQRVYHLSPIISMKLQDSQGTTYKVSSAPSIRDPLGGPINPGQTVRGEVGFMVPKSEQNLTFIFEPGLTDAHDIRVNFNVN